jgi:hypothetical protein
VSRLNLDPRFQVAWPAYFLILALTGNQANAPRYHFHKKVIAAVLSLEDRDPASFMFYATGLDREQGHAAEATSLETVSAAVLYIGEWRRRVSDTYVRPHGDAC